MTKSTAPDATLSCYIFILFYDDPTELFPLVSKKLPMDIMQVSGY